jgi:hypothetical protein
VSCCLSAKLENLFWKNVTALPFEKFLTHMNEAFKELEDAGQPLFPAQKVLWLLCGVEKQHSGADHIGHHS